ncbi:MAG: 16S rRNA (guanine(527)-N(7))-methyltransferase RsmG [Clostridiales bacterium]|nr:16S rRNA (guanine(527)-N(7))-methyltransferase RsmG [Clostridiales bacterium]
MNSTNAGNREQYIRNCFDQAGLPLSERQAEQFLIYYDLLIEKNRVVNLTAITEFEDVVKKHFLDSVLVWKTFPLTPGRLIDIGTGAGFPGIPLKIVFPELQVVLLDSLNKRIAFLDTLIEKLELTSVSAVHGRAEDLASDSFYREKFDFCVSRAVANLSSLSEYCLPFVKRGGVFIAYKSVEIDQECQDAKKAIFLLGGVLESREKTRIPGTDIERSFIVVRKERGTPAKYPRKAGTPTKSPLK